MKIRNLFFAGLAVCSLAACSNDDEPGIEGAGSPASLSIDVASAINSKAYSDTQTDAEATMKNTIITVAGAGFSRVYDAAEYVKTGTITIQKGEGLVVGGNYTVTAEVKGDQAATYPTVALASETAAKGFTMYGTKSTGALQSSGNTVEVVVNRTAARVDFESLELAYAGPSQGTIKVTNFKVESVKLTGVNDAADAKSGVGSTAAAAELAGTYTGSVALGSSATELGQFYVYPNSAKTTYLVIAGKLVYSDGTEMPTTYSTAIDGTTAGQAAPISRNTIYNIAAKITGDGTGIEGTDLTLTITCADWSTVSLTPDLD